MSNKPHSLHHINFPSTDTERTKEWYCKVFGMKWVNPQSDTKILLLTNGNFDIHFTPFPKDRFKKLKPLHFAIEVEDWDGFLAHLDALEIRHTRTVHRPQNDSKFCYVHDPDGNMVELTYHGKLHKESSVAM
jgi:catechol 2,3-dioxygenase-like lactoylglutathione lyase family enzyme